MISPVEEALAMLDERILVVNYLRKKAKLIPRDSQSWSIASAHALEKAARDIEAGLHKGTK